MERERQPRKASVRDGIARCVLARNAEAFISSKLSSYIRLMA